MIQLLSRLPRIVLALLIQGLVLCLLFVGVTLAPLVVEPPYPYLVLVILQGGIAAAVSCRLGLPCWWRWIQFLLPVGLYVGVWLNLDPAWALLLFSLVWLFFSNVIKDRVPLYFTNSITREALRQLVKSKDQVRFMDLGCGFASNVIFMSQQKEVVLSCGVETAPLPYLISKLRVLMAGGKTLAQDLWKTDLQGYNFVYAFLSSEPMPRLWQKVEREMAEGSVFVSNSFPVPGVEPSEVWELSDARKTMLYVYYL